MNDAGNTGLTRRRIVVLVATLAALYLAGGALWLRQQTRAVREHRLAELASIGRLKAAAIAAWRSERLADAAVLTASPELAADAVEVESDANSPARDRLLARMRALGEHYGYSDVQLVTPAGAALLRLAPAGETHEDALRAFAQAIATRAPVFVDLHRSPADGEPHVAVVAPLFAGGGAPAAPVAAIVLVCNARDYLFPFIQSWPVPSESAESLLVERRGDLVLFLNDLRFRDDAALALEVPLSATEVPAVQAVLGRMGEFEGRDYRGVPVVADLRPIPDSPWFLVAKVDRAEILAPIRGRALAALLAVIGLIAVSALGTAYVYKAQGKAAFAARYRAERERREALEELEATLRSIGDAVIATDSEGRVTLVNPVAEALTGWSAPEAAGRPLAEVFRIIDESTREAVEDPVSRVLRENTVVGLVNHTVLVARDGSERPIADSGAPVRDEHGAAIGVVLVFRDQSRERQAQRESNLLGSTIRAARDEIYLFDAGTLRFRFVNDGALRNLGFGPEEITHLTPLDIKPEFTRERFAELVEPLRRGVAPLLTFETVHARKDGSRYPVEVHLQLLDVLGDQVFLAVIQDITVRRASELAMQRLNRTLRTLSECNQTLVRATDEATLLADICRHIVELGGYRMAWVGLAVDDAERSVHPAAIAGHDEGYVRSVRATWGDGERGRGPTGTAIRDRRPVIAGDLAAEPDYGPWRDAALARGYASSIAVPLLIDTECLGALSLYASEPHAFDDEEVSLLTELATDIAFGVRTLRDRAARAAAERGLREGEEKFAAAFHNSPIAMAMTAMDNGTYHDVNDVFLRDSGYTREEVIGRTSVDLDVFARPADRQRLVADVLAKGRVYGMPCTVRMKDGAVREALISACQISVGGTRYFLSAILDVSELKRAEDELRASRSELEAISDGAPVMICVLDETRRVLTGNLAFRQASGWPDTAIRSDRACGVLGCINALDHPDGCGFGPRCAECRLRRAIEDTLATGRSHRDVECEATLLRHGRQQDVVLLASTNPFELGGRRRLVLCLVDITERRALELQLRQAQRLEAVGTLAGGIAHDFNNLLQALLSSVQAARLQAGDTELARSLAEILGQIQRGATLTRQLLLFSRQSRARREPLDLAALVADHAAMLRRLLPETIALEVEPGGEPLTVEGDAGQLGQVLTNLVVNARDAMPDGGRIVVATQRAGDDAVVAVSDTGAGIAPELRERIFDPFFTTKAQGKGTGLGLAVVWGIVKEHGGRTEVDSEPGRGSAFRVVLPISTAGAVAKPAIEATPLPSGRRERVLVVEDEEGARQGLVDLLSALNYEVSAAPSGEAALAIPASESIDLLLTDFRLPGVTGTEVARALRATRPHLRVVVMSGYAPEDLAHDLESDTDSVHFLQKPFDMAALAQALRDALAPT